MNAAVGTPFAIIMIIIRIPQMSCVSKGASAVSNSMTLPVSSSAGLKRMKLSPEDFIYSWSICSITRNKRDKSLPSLRRQSRKIIPFHCGQMF